MMNEKVLTLRGKKAVWAPSPAGVGGGGGITLYCDETYVDVSAEAPESLPSANTSYTIYKDDTFTTALSVEEKKTLYNKCLEVLKNGGHVSACQKTSNGITYYPNGVCRIADGFGLQIIWETSEVGLQFMLMNNFAMAIGLGD